MIDTRPLTRLAVTLVVTATLALPLPAAGQGMVVHDPSHAATSTENLSQLTQMLQEARRQTMELRQHVQSFGATLAGDVMAALPGMDAAFLSTVQDIVQVGREVAGTVQAGAALFHEVRALGNAVGQSLTWEGLTSDFLAGVNQGLAQHLQLQPGQLASITGARTAVTGAFGAPAPGAGGVAASPAEARAVERRRRAESEAATLDAMATALQSLASAERANQRIQALADAANQATDQQQQLRILSQSMMAVTEEMAALRLVIAAQTRMRAAHEMAQQPLLTGVTPSQDQEAAE